MGTFRSTCVMVAMAFACGTAAGQQEPEGGFPFVIPPEGPRPGTAASDLARPLGVAGADGPVVIKYGHFASARRDRRLVFWGTNLTFDGCFPEHDVAARVAKRLASLGVNCVRFHHMDTTAWPRGLWVGREWGAFEHKEFEPKALDRLDYLVAQLKKNGIYTNINLQVGRQFGPPDGYPQVSDRNLARGKGVSLFHPRMKEDLKRFARMLLDRENPYTGLRYADEPALAMVEISNECGLLSSWASGALEGIPDEYQGHLAAAWNRWLKGRYETDAALREAWGGEAGDRSGPDMLADIPGRLQTAGEARADLAEARGPGGAGARRVDVRRATGTTWHVQYHWAPLAIEKGQAYRVRLAVRGKAGASVSLSVMNNHDPWQSLGLRESIQLGPEWREVELYLTATADDAPTEEGGGGARLTLSGLGVEGLWIEFTQPVLQTTTPIGLPTDESIGAVAWPARSGREGRTQAVMLDMVAFLRETEVEYWQEMRLFLREELGIRAPITGTAVTYTTPWIARESVDFVDGHAYWQHPHWPGVPAWSRTGWVVRQLPMVNDPRGGQLASLAFRRSLADPFTVTEYNHPAPNRYECEGFPMIAAFASQQNWDGVFTFNYVNNASLETDHFLGYFDWAGHPVKAAVQPACSAVIRFGEVPTGDTVAGVRLTLDERIDALLRGGPRQYLYDGLASYSRTEPWKHGHCSVVACECEAEPNRGEGGLTWDQSDPERSWLSYRGKGCMGLVGFVDGRTLRHQDMILTPGRTSLDGFSAVMVNAVDGQERLGDAGRYLVTAVARCWNQGMGWNEAGDSVGEQWGTGPSLCEGVPLALTVVHNARAAALHALKPDGSRAASVGGNNDELGVSAFYCGPDYRTLWYELVIGEE